jgi:hypothetical protein
MITQALHAPNAGPEAFGRIPPEMLSRLASVAVTEAFGTAGQYEKILGQQPASSAMAVAARERLHTELADVARLLAFLARNLPPDSPESKTHSRAQSARGARTVKQLAKQVQQQGELPLSFRRLLGQRETWRDEFGRSSSVPAYPNL